jgi:hypothetical protein
MAYKLFSTGEVLTAANVNSYLMRQTVMVFADAAARTTALSGVLAEGMVSYLQSTKKTEVYDGTSWNDFTGDITGVTAGTGLSGGGTSGTVTVSIDTATTVDKTTAQTLTNKTLTDPVVTESVNAQTGTTYTPVLGDAKQMVTLSNASAITVTIPPNSSVAYTAGSKIDFIQKGAGQVSFAQGSGVTIRSVGATATAPKLRVQYSAATCWYEGSDVWYIVGDIA